MRRSVRCTDVARRIYVVARDLESELSRANPCLLGVGFVGAAGKDASEPCPEVADESHHSFRFHRLRVARIIAASASSPSHASWSVSLRRLFRENIFTSLA